MIKKFLFLLLCFCWLSGYTQVTDTTYIEDPDKTVIEAPTVVEAEDTATYYDDDEEVDTAYIEEDEYTSITPRNISIDSINALKRSKGYEYMAFYDSLLRARQKEEEVQPRRVERSTGGGIFDLGFMHFLLWGLAIAAVLFVVFKLFMDGGSLFTRRNKTLMEAPPEEEVEIDTDNLDPLIKKAIDAGNYRLATRYLYMQSLKFLSNKNHIILSPQKTNQQYVNELRSGHLFQPFSRLTLQYDYIWFGEFAVNENQFKMVHNNFKEFNNSI